MDFEEAAEETKRVALSFSNPLVVHHYDTDGITSGAIVSAALMNAGKRVRRRWIKTLDNVAIESLSGEKEIIFLDLGSGNPRVNELTDVVIIDHHQPDNGVKQLQFNPHLYGVDGGTELSSSGAAYFVFGNNVEFAITGAIGDMQYPFIGKNEIMLKDAIASGDVVVERDISFYGRYSRPLEAFLLYSDNPYIPGFSYNERRVKDVISRLNISDHTIRYADLTNDQKQMLITSIVDYMLSFGINVSADELIQDNYVFPKFKGTVMYDANELSTLLNACGRNDKADVGVDLLLGSEGALNLATRILSVHRRNLKRGIEFANSSISDLGAFNLIDARGVIPEGIIGIVCGMLLYMSSKPIIGLATSDGMIKVSGRTKDKRVNLGIIMRESASNVGGIGGGHKMAAGAHIPKDKINEFLLHVGRMLEDI